MADCNCCVNYLILTANVAAGGYDITVNKTCDNLCSCLTDGTIIFIYDNVGNYVGTGTINSCSEGIFVYNINIICDEIVDDNYEFQIDVSCSSIESISSLSSISSFCECCEIINCYPPYAYKEPATNMNYIYIPVNCLEYCVCYDTYLSFHAYASDMTLLGDYTLLWCTMNNVSGGDYYVIMFEDILLDPYSVYYIEPICEESISSMSSISSLSTYCRCEIMYIYDSLWAGGDLYDLYIEGFGCELDNAWNIGDAITLILLSSNVHGIIQSITIDSNEPFYGYRIRVELSDYTGGDIWDNYCLLSECDSVSSLSSISSISDISGSCCEIFDVFIDYDLVGFHYLWTHPISNWPNNKYARCVAGDSIEVTWSTGDVTLETVVSAYEAGVEFVVVTTAPLVYPSGSAIEFQLTGCQSQSSISSMSSVSCCCQIWYPYVSYSTPDFSIWHFHILRVDGCPGEDLWEHCMCNHNLVVHWTYGQTTVHPITSVQNGGANTFAFVTGDALVPITPGSGGPVTYVEIEDCSSYSNSCSSSSSQPSQSSQSVPSCSQQDDITITKMECYTYAFDSDYWAQIHVRIYDANTNLPAFDIDGNAINYYIDAGEEIELEHIDGVYHVFLNSYTCPVDTYIVELCDMYECISGLQSYIECCETNPCCDTCDTSIKDKKEIAEEALIKLNNYDLLMKLALNKEHIDNPDGYTPIAADIVRINVLMQRIKDVITRCECESLNCN